MTCCKAWLTSDAYRTRVSLFNGANGISQCPFCECGKTLAGRQRTSCERVNRMQDWNHAAQAVDCRVCQP